MAAAPTDDDDHVLSGARLLSRIDEIVHRCVGHTMLRIVTAITGPAQAVDARLAGHAEVVVREIACRALEYAGADTLVVTVSLDDYLTVTVETLGTEPDRDGGRPDAFPALEARARLVSGRCEYGPGNRVTWYAPLNAVPEQARPPIEVRPNPVGQYRF